MATVLSIALNGMRIKQESHVVMIIQEEMRADCFRVDICGSKNNLI